MDEPCSNSDPVTTRETAAAMFHHQAMCCPTAALPRPHHDSTRNVADEATCQSLQHAGNSHQGDLWKFHCVCICVCVCIYIYIYTYVCVCVSVCVGDPYIPMIVGFHNVYRLPAAWGLWKRLFRFQSSMLSVAEAETSAVEKMKSGIGDPPKKVNLVERT